MDYFVCLVLASPDESAEWGERLATAMPAGFFWAALEKEWSAGPDYRIHNYQNRENFLTFECRRHPRVHSPIARSRPVFSFRRLPPRWKRHAVLQQLGSSYCPWSVHRSSRVLWSARL